MKRVAKEEPVVAIVEVAHPIQVGFTLRVVPPDIARLLVALEGFVRNISCTTAP
jgi:hypothetical protein